MDSLTQIILGAGVGEVVLGKKLGNRAMIWGGIAGTIPDLDIVGNLFLNELDALAFHRGISHSFFFAIVFSFFIALIAHRLYATDFYKRKIYKGLVGAITSSFLILVFLGIFSVLNKILGMTGIILGSSLGILLYFPLRRILNYFRQPTQNEVNVTYKEWYWFFFWTIITHPILDSFTAYGTQLFAPFSDYRVAFNNISVADPLYTIPFLICIIIASRYARSDSKRRFYTWLGIGLSSTYMLFTIFNKSRVDGILEKTLKSEEISYDRFTTNPSILNNFLWSGTAQNGDTYYQGTYSFFDKTQRFKLRPITQNLDLIDEKIEDPTIKCLRWFSNNYYGLITRKDGKIQFNDLRFGKFNAEGNDEKDYIFRFVLGKNDGDYFLEKTFAGPPNEDRKEIFIELWDRLKGI
jgi:inner membrane protein